MNTFLPYGSQWIDDADIEAVIETLRSPYLTTGPRVSDFEGNIAAKVGADHVVAVSSATAALHGACHVLGLQPDDEVVVPAITFLSTANAVRFVGAKVVFCDVCPGTGLMRPEDLERVLTSKTKAVMPVHLTGAPCDLEALAAICAPRGITMIEDAAHALGATYRDSVIGDSRWSAMQVFSFHPVKQITTGEGGAISTNDPDLEHRLRRFLCHGLEREQPKMVRKKPGPWYYEQQELGYNYRITDIQGALGSSQLRKLDDFVAQRRRLAAHYDERFKDNEAVRPNAPGPRGGVSAYHLYSVRIDFEGLRMNRREVMAALAERGVGTQVHYIPVPTQPYYMDLGYSADDLPGAREYYDRTLSLPLYPRLTIADIDRVADVVDDVVGSQRVSRA